MNEVSEKSRIVSS